MNKNESGVIFMEIKTDTQFTRNVKCADVYTESFADYSLPDYLGDVRKILFTEASVRPAGRFASGDEIELSGVVIYNLIYLDSEGKLSSAEFTSDYDYSVKCNGEKYKDSVSDTRVSSFGVRAAGPRKLTARASLVGSVRVSETDTVEVMGDAFEMTDAPEINTKTVKIHKMISSSTTEREFAESIARLDGAIADEVRVVYSIAEPCVENVDLDGSNVALRGKLCMRVVIQNDSEPAYLVDKTVDFDENVAFDDDCGDMKLSPSVAVTSVKTNINPDDSGCNITMSCILEFSSVGEKNEPVSLALDGYLVSSATDNRYDDFKYNELVDFISLHESHTAEVAKSELGEDAIDDIIFVSATPKIESINKDGDEIKISGEVKYSGIYASNTDASTGYSMLKFSSPFEIKANKSCQNNENRQVFVKITANSASAYVSENKMCASCILDALINVVEEKNEKILVSLTVKEDEEIVENEGRITVYYPSDDDTLFSVAKRFRTSAVKVAADNELTESVFADDGEGGKLVGVKRLLIY